MVVRSVLRLSPWRVWNAIMSDSSDPTPPPPAADGKAHPLPAPRGEDAGNSRELKVPRSIVRWSKWRKAALRAEHREVRRQLQAAASKSRLPSGPTTPTDSPRTTIESNESSNLHS